MSLSFTLNHDCLSQQQHLFRVIPAQFLLDTQFFLVHLLYLINASVTTEKIKHNHDLCLAIYTMTSMYIYSTAIYSTVQSIWLEKNTSSCFSANAVSMDLIIIGEFFFLYEECSAPWPSVL